MVCIITNNIGMHTGTWCPLLCLNTRSRPWTQAPRHGYLIAALVVEKNVFTLILVPYEYHTRVPFQVWMLSKKLLRHYPQNWVLCRTKQSQFKVGVFLPVPRHWFPGSQPSGQPFCFLLPQPKILWDEIKQGQIILFFQLLFSNKNNPQIIYFSCASPKQ